MRRCFMITWAVGFAAAMVLVVLLAKGFGWL